MSWLLALALAVAPLADPAQEARALALEQELRCVSCVSEPISQSGAETAQDMRRILRQRIAAGDTDQEVRRYFADRYGDFVLLRPPVKADTAALWLAPLGLFLLGLLAFVSLSRRGGREFAADAEPDER